MDMLKQYKATLGGQEILVETGKLAQQAGGAVTVRLGDSVVLVTATASEQPREGLDFLPVKAHAREQAYYYFPALGGDGLYASPGGQDFHFQGVEQVIYFGGRGTKAVAEFLGYGFQLLDPVQLYQFLVETQPGK